MSASTDELPNWNITLLCVCMTRDCSRIALNAISVSVIQNCIHARVIQTCHNVIANFKDMMIYCNVIILVLIDEATKLQ